MSDNFQTKLISISNPAGGPGQDLREVRIAPGTTAADVLAELNLDGYYLQVPGTALHLGGEEPLWDHLQDHAKLIATPRGDVGATHGVKILSGNRRAPLIKPRSVTLAQVRGWRAAPGDRNLLEGDYLTQHFGRVPGYIKLRGGDAIDGLPSFYVVTPPPAILAGPHGPCFRKRAPNVYWVHFNDRRMSVDAGIAAIEMQLSACGKRVAQ